MTHTIIINQEKQSITINNLTVTNADFFGVIATEPPESQVQAVQDVIAVGSAAMQRMHATIDVDFVEKRFHVLSSGFEKALGQLEQRAVDSLSQRFSPTESGSYTKQISDLIGEARRDVQSWNKELALNAGALLDPEKKTSGVAKIGELIEHASQRFQQMFDPDQRTSYAYRLNQQLSQVFGTDGRAGTLQAALGEALKPVFAELQEVKLKIEAKKAAEQIFESSTQKGKTFEALVLDELSHLAQPFGDDVQSVASGANGSRAGDFLVSFRGMAKTAVIEARNRKQMGLPEIKDDLDREIKERSADFAIYVSSGVEMLPKHVGDFQIYGNKVVSTAENLHIAYRLVRVLAASQAPDGSVDVGGLRHLLNQIKDAARSLRSLKSKATQVEKFGKDITSDANGVETIILGLIDEAEKLLQPPTPKPTALAETA